MTDLQDRYRTSSAAARAAWAAGALCLAVLAAAVARRHGPLGVDSQVLDLLRRHPGPTSAARVLTQGGSALVDVVVLVVSVVAASRLRSPRLLLALPALLVGQALRLGTSRLVDRPRPPAMDRLTSASGLAWPSGHTTGATLGWGLVAFLLAVLLPARRPDRVALLVAAGAGALVGATRVLLHVHWLTDALGGVVLGLLLLVPAMSVLQPLRRRVPPGQSTPLARRS